MNFLIFFKKNFKYISQRRFLQTLILILIFCLAFTIIYFYQVSENKKTIANISQKIYKNCINSVVWKKCYFDEFGELIKYRPLTFVIDILKILQVQDKRTVNCHTVAHLIASSELNKNYQKWQNIAKSVDIDDCGNGYIHGIIEGLLLNKQLSIDEISLNKFCQESEKSFKGNKADLSANCFHTLGHYLILQYQGDIDKSTNMCMNFKDGDKAYFCLSGVFMEEFARAGLSAHGIKPLLTYNWQSIELEESICKGYSGLVQKACWREIVTMYRAVSSSYLDLYNNCQRALDIESKDECYSYGIFLLVSAGDTHGTSTETLCTPLLEREQSYKYCVALIVVALSFSPDNIKASNDLCQKIPSRFVQHCQEVNNRRFKGSSFF